AAAPDAFFNMRAKKHLPFAFEDGSWLKSLASWPITAVFSELMATSSTMQLPGSDPVVGGVWDVVGDVVHAATASRVTTIVASRFTGPSRPSRRRVPRRSGSGRAGPRMRQAESSNRLVEGRS